MQIDFNKLQRVAVIGTSCSGKTTFARHLASKLNERHIELDSIHWGRNWTPTPKEEFRTLVSHAVAPDRWVLDGNYGSVRDIVWARATTLIWLNYPFRVVGGRALSRTVGRIISREELWSGNRESFRISFLSSDSILWWVATTYHRRRREYPLLFKDPAYQHLQVITIHSPADAERLLATSDLSSFALDQ
jgi:adenylate kinase family enzyme